MFTCLSDAVTNQLMENGGLGCGGDNLFKLRKHALFSNTMYAKLII